MDKSQDSKNEDLEIKTPTNDNNESAELIVIPRTGIKQFIREYREAGKPFLSLSGNFEMNEIGSPEFKNKIKWGEKGNNSKKGICAIGYPYLARETIDVPSVEEFNMSSDPKKSSAAYEQQLGVIMPIDIGIPIIVLAYEEEFKCFLCVRGDVYVIE